MPTRPLIVVLLLCPLGRALAEAPAQPPSATATAPTVTLAPRCSPAAITDVRLPVAVQVDEIRVVVASRSPAASAAQIRVGAGDFDRVLHLQGPASHDLKFFPALTSSQFRVELGPVLPAPSSPCVERIELWRSGAAVATVTP